MSIKTTDMKVKEVMITKDQFPQVKPNDFLKLALDMMTDYNLGIVYQKIQEFELSINSLMNSIKLDDNRPEYHNSLGISYQKLDKGILNFFRNLCCFATIQSLFDISLRKDFRSEYL